MLGCSCDLDLVFYLGGPLWDIFTLRLLFDLVFFVCLVCLCWFPGFVLMFDMLGLLIVSCV